MSHRRSTLGELRRAPLSCTEVDFKHELQERLGEDGAVSNERGNPLRIDAVECRGERNRSTHRPERAAHRGPWWIGW